MDRRSNRGGDGAPGLGRLVRRYRTLRLMTQGEVAEKLGTTYQTVQQWEMGRRQPRFSSLKKVIEVLGIPMDEVNAAQMARGGEHDADRG